MAMRKTLVKVDEDLLAEARQALGTTSIVDTVNRSLREVVAMAARRRTLDLERRLSESIDDPDDERRRAWD
jgi:Arc/MetJ family transcription regulator